MANYPGANPSFTTKQDGVDYPQAAHINLVQDEIVAIGSALRGGLSHALTVNGALAVSTGGVTVSTGGLRVSGPSTLANLQAADSTVAALTAGASTLASLQVSGNSTFAGSVTFSGTIRPAIPAVVVTNGSTTAISSATWTGVSWNTDVWNPNGMHSTSANSSRVVFADSTGVYLVTASVTTSSLAAGAWLGRIRVNDTTAVAYTDVNGFSNLSGGLTLCAHVRAASTADYVTVQVQSLNSTGFVYADGDQTPVRLSASLVSR